MRQLETRAAAVVPPSYTQRIIMQTAGLKDREITALATLKARIASGAVSESTPEHKRLIFARYLYEAGRIK